MAHTYPGTQANVASSNRQPGQYVRALQSAVCGLSDCAVLALWAEGCAGGQQPGCKTVERIWCSLHS